MYTRSNSKTNSSERARLNTRRFAEPSFVSTSVSVRPFHRALQGELLVESAVKNTRSFPPGAGLLADEGWGTPHRHPERRIELRKDHHGNWSLQLITGGKLAPGRVGTFPGAATFALCSAWGSRASRWGKHPTPV